MQFSVILLLPAASRSAVGKACATADRDPESACEPEQQTSQSRNKPVSHADSQSEQRGMYPSPFPPLSSSLFCHWRR